MGLESNSKIFTVSVQGLLELQVSCALNTHTHTFNSKHTLEYEQSGSDDTISVLHNG